MQQPKPEVVEYRSIGSSSHLDGSQFANIQTVLSELQKSKCLSFSSVAEQKKTTVPVAKKQLSKKDIKGYSSKSRISMTGPEDGHNY